jgi:hypothetical protein
LLDVVDGEPLSAPEVDLDIYHVADDPAHAFVYRALRRRPGLVVLEEWNLHRLVHGATAGRGDEDAYRREARRCHGPLGSFCAQQVLEGRGGRLPSLLTLNQRVLEAASALVATSRLLQARAAAHLRGRPLIHLPLGFLGMEPPAEGAGAERGPDSGTPVVLFIRARDGHPGGAETHVLESVRRAVPRATLAHAPEDARDLPTSLANADIVVALEDPPRAGLGDAIPRALALGRATLVSAGSGAGQEVPEGIVAHVTPGSTEAAETAGLVRRLLEDDGLRARLGARAGAFAAARGHPAAAAKALHDILVAAPPRRVGERLRVGAPRNADDLLASRAVQEIAVAGRELDLPELPPGVVPLVSELFPEGSM